MQELKKAVAREVIERIIAGKIKTSNQLNFEKHIISGKFGFSQLVRNSDILKYALPEEKSRLKLLLKKPMRTASGVAIVAVMSKPHKCPGKCIYCPQGKDAPKSYTGKEPAARRAKMFEYDPYVQVTRRIGQLDAIGHSTDKVELIIMGGTFPSLSWKYQKDFVKRCLDALNGKTSRTLKRAQEENRRAESRCVGLTIETRPDFCKNEHIDRMLELGATRVELGVQTTSDDIYKKIGRGHNVRDVVAATQLMKDSGLKVVYHIMPGLFQSPQEDLAMFKKLFSNPDFCPDMLKIYPALVIRGTKLYDLWKAKKYAPLNNADAAELVAKIKGVVPGYVRIMRVQRDIPADEIVAGVTASNLRELAQAKMKELGIKCKCIRCREWGQNQGISIGKLTENVTEYKASGGTEYFISLDDFEGRESSKASSERSERDDKSSGLLFGHLRLRVPAKPFRKELLGKTAIVRELKVFGESVPLGETRKKALQHRGFGKRLMARAEKIAKENGAGKIAVIAALGTKDYYKKLGYCDDGVYMSKMLK